MIHSCAMRVLLAGGLFCLVCLAPVGGALALAQQAQAAAQEVKDLRGEAEALNFIADAGRFPEALELRDRDVQAAELARLTEAIDREQTLKGLLPTCASCKKIRDDSGYWTQVEAYVAAHALAEFPHSICPSCFEGLYPEHHHHEQPRS